MDIGVIVGLVLRHVLTGIGAAAVAKGYITEDVLTQVVGAVGTLAAVGWSFWQKAKSGTLTKPAA